MYVRRQGYGVRRGRVWQRQARRWTTETEMDVSIFESEGSDKQRRMYFYFVPNFERDTPPHVLSKVARCLEWLNVSAHHPANVIHPCLKRQLRHLATSLSFPCTVPPTEDPATRLNWGLRGLRLPHHGWHFLGRTWSKLDFGRGTVAAMGFRKSSRMAKSRFLPSGGDSRGLRAIEILFVRTISARLTTMDRVPIKHPRAPDTTSSILPFFLFPSRLHARLPAPCPGCMRHSWCPPPPQTPSVAAPGRARSSAWSSRSAVRGQRPRHAF